MGDSLHEFSVMERTVRRILERLNGENYERVLKVRMVVGELTHLSEEQMKFSFQVLTKGTPLEGSVLEIVKKRAKVKCEECSYHGEIPRVDESYLLPLFKCPSCGGKLIILEGRECYVDSVEVE